MARAKAETIQERLKNGFNIHEHNRIYKLLCWTFGQKEDAYAKPSADGDFPDYPDVMPREVEIGQSKRILSSQFIRLTQAQYGEASPEFPDLDRYTGEVLKQAYLRRSRGESLGGALTGEWAPHRAKAFLSGDGVGVGWLQIGLKTNKASGQQYTYARNVDSTNVIWDPFVSDPGDASWVCFVHSVDPDKARKLYGSEAVDKNLRTITENGIQAANATRQVFRIFEYYDRGIGDDDPTMALIPGVMMNEPIALVDNPFGECLPLAYYTHFTPPNCRRPLGRIMMQISTQEAINRVEERLKRTLDTGGAFDCIDLTMVDADDVKDIKAGKFLRFVRFTKSFDGKPPTVRIPAVDVTPGDVQVLAMYERQMADDSGTTDHDRGLLSSQARTLGENEMLDAKQAPKVNWSRLQAGKMERRLVEKWMYIAKMFDRDPLMVSVFGAKVLLNDPQDPRSWLAQFMQDPTAVLVDEADLQYQDLQQKQGQRLVNLEQLLPRVQGNSPTGRIDPEWYDRELLKAIGEKDPDSALVAPPMAMGVGGMQPAVGGPGMPMPGGMQMPPGVPPSPGMQMPQPGQ